MKKKWAIVFFICTFIFFGGESSFGQVLNGFESGEIHVLLPSLNYLKCSINLKVEKLNDKKVKITIVDGEISDSFAARSNSHNRSATYKLNDKTNSLFYVDDKTIDGESIIIEGQSLQTFGIKGRKTFVWQTNPGKISAGFPRAYYKTIYTKTTLVSFDEDGKVTVEEKEDDQEEVVIPNSIEGTVSHNETWDKRRIEKKRREDYYWPGEGLVLKAKVKGSDKAQRVVARVENSPFQSILTFDGTTWNGWLWHDKLLDLWTGKKDFKVNIIFTAYFKDENCQDLETIVIDDSNNYWKLHRKE